MWTAEKGPPALFLCPRGCLVSGAEAMGLDPASSLSTKVDEPPRRCQWQPMVVCGGLCRSLWWLVVSSVVACGGVCGGLCGGLSGGFCGGLWRPMQWLVLAATPACQPVAIEEPATHLVGRGIKGSKGPRSGRDGVGGGAMRIAREFRGEAEGAEGYGVELAGAGGRAAAARIGVVRAGDGAADVARGGVGGGAREARAVGGGGRRGASEPVRALPRACAAVERRQGRQEGTWAMFSVLPKGKGRATSPP
jgi:hypothetical protein